MGTVADWVMVVITTVYVIATIVICYANIRSANASKEQLKESQKQLDETIKQQKQNIGLQLYEKRKEVLDKFIKKEYDDIFWDVQLLFTATIFDDFSTLSMCIERKKQVQERVREFENHLRYDFEDESVFNEFVALATLAQQRDDYEKLYRYCDKYSFIQKSKIDNCNYSYNYKELSLELDKMKTDVSIHHNKVFYEMKEFIENSIR